ncbi:hypothetical protein HJC23_003537 [Cyclotella cryptica]|uniref:HSF-type DNA-binding domain-containing protein n=1 Tax=Cyclotella cryptica TaxID=29204 RepID=A0ABD3NZ43_9STRA|eukprot:CCRYP_018596-RB/>CCRYP_018596-RB protein AED:0.00 eAED:0.00 QI:221/-1/1/1/-1/1/1/194/438
MCITSTARRSSLKIPLLPTHLLKRSTEQSTQSFFSSGDARTNAYLSALPSAKPAACPLRTTSSIDHESSSEHCGKGQVVVRHDYHDHSTDPVVDPSQIKHKAKGGVVVPFPVKLHSMLDAIERDGYAHVVSWQPHGRCFVVHKPKEFVNHIMPKYFKQSKMASFQRQLNLYGFNRLTGGLDKGGYYHELFLRGKVGLAYKINRMRVKGTGVRMPTNPDSEPNLYALPPVSLDGVVPAATSSSSEAKKPAPAPRTFNLELRRAELERQSHAHSEKIRASAAATAADFAPPLESSKSREEDLVFFEGCPFHYLDPNALAPAPRARVALPSAFPKSSESVRRPQPPKHSSSVVSDSSDASDDEDNFLPSFSADNMDWEGPLANLEKESTMNMSMKTALEDDIENFFSGFDMPLERYHAEIENMSEDDDTAFGYLLERAISE